jgi:hypothetical protein
VATVSDPRERVAFWLLKYNAVPAVRVIRVSRIHELLRIQYEDVNGKIRYHFMTLDKVGDQISY